MLSDSVDAIEMPNVNVMKAKDMKQEEFLKTIPLFSHLKKGQFEDLNKFLTLKTFQMNEDIIVQGSTEVSMPMYIIKSGEVWCSIADEAPTVDDEGAVELQVSHRWEIPLVSVGTLRSFELENDPKVRPWHVAIMFQIHVLLQNWDLEMFLAKLASLTLNQELLHAHQSQRIPSVTN